MTAKQLQVDKAERHPISPRQQRVLLTVMMLVATALRFYQLGTESIWIDEHFSILDAESLDLGTRPLYYALLHVWMQFGSSDAWLRSLSIPFSLGSIVLVYQLSRRLLSSAAIGLMAALLMTLSPLFVGYAQEIRMYALSTFLGLWGTLILAQVLQNPRSVRPLSVIGWLVTRLLAVMSTPLNVLLLLPDILLLFWRFRRNRKVMVAFGIGLALVGVLWIPFAQVLSEAAPRFMGGWVIYQPDLDLIQILAMLSEVTVFWPVSDLQTLRGAPALFDWGWERLITLFYTGFTGIAVSVLGVGVLQLVRKQRHQLELWWLAAWAFLPIAVIAIVSVVSASIWRERYLMLAVPYVFILLAVGMIEIWRRYRAIAFAVAIAYAVAVSGGLYHYYTTLYHDDWRGVAEFIRSNEQPGDAIGFYGWQWEPQLTVPRYYQGSADFYDLQREPLPQPEAAQSRDSFIQDMFQQLPPDSSRYWLVVLESSPTGRKKIHDSIYQQFNVLENQTFPNSVNAPTDVFLVTPKGQ
ncbi:MAG: glycosyltransferase family 39 protein [Phormidesmis sp.]